MALQVGLSAALETKSSAVEKQWQDTGMAGELPSVRQVFHPVEGRSKQGFWAMDASHRTIESASLNSGSGRKMAAGDTMPNVDRTETRSGTNHFGAMH